MKPVYFDLTVENIDDATAFFQEVLNWKFKKMEMPFEYYTIQAGSALEGGIDGGIGAIQDTKITGGRPMTVVTMQVPNIDVILQKVLASKGRIVEEKREIPAVGFYATCAEPGGLLFGLIEPF